MRLLLLLALLSASKTVVNKTTAPKPVPAMEGLGFGTTFSDHMVDVDWHSATGWQAPVIKPYGDLTISPAATVLHYAVECFEGMKAYKDAQGNIRFFRPDCNIARLNDSLRRLYLPTVDPAEFMKLLTQLVKLDQHWIPDGDGNSLYIRPAAIGLDSVLGLGPCSSAKLFIITCPVGPYYPTGFKPVKLYADDTNVRAWHGGVGAAKVGGNYAPSIAPQMEAHKKGCAQVLWLYPEGGEHVITEVGAMNLFVVIKTKDGKHTELVTAPLDGTILPGVTRRSILELARQSGEYLVSERKLTMSELIEASKDGRLVESFGAGTAAVIAPVNSIMYKDVSYDFPTGNDIGPIAKSFWDKIGDIQYGRVEHEWSVVCK
jgi:branched-chain amino acid aminotransferase